MIKNKMTKTFLGQKKGFAISHFRNMFLVREVEVFSKDFSFISLPVYVNDCDAKKKFKEKKLRAKMRHEWWSTRS